MVCQGGQHVIYSFALPRAQQQADNDAIGTPIARGCSNCIERFAHTASEGNNGWAMRREALCAAGHADGCRLRQHGEKKKDISVFFALK